MGTTGFRGPAAELPADPGGTRLPESKRASDLTLGFVADLLAAEGSLSDECRRLAFARESVQRARLLRAGAHDPRRGRRAPLSPIQLLASFRFPDARRPQEVLDEDRVSEVLARAVAIPYRKIDPLALDDALITRALSRPFARSRCVLPLELRNGILTVALGNPFDRELLEELRNVTGWEIETVLSAPGDILRAIAEVYGFRLSIRAAQHGMPVADWHEAWTLSHFVDLRGLEALEASSAPVLAACEYLLHYAFEQRASDIHIEPRREDSLVRMRIDGVLHPIYRVPKAVHAALTNRFKVMSRLDIAGKKPQDGRIRTALGGTEMELRVSSMPTAHGDKVVVRILDPSTLLRGLSELGLTEGQQARIERWLLRPQGLILVTGPTGCGKTTTLYSALQALASAEVNIVTIEDPIEMVHEDFNQIQANVKTGTSFAQALRHVLRQDPNVIMVGEVRDSETASQAAQAALTGHLVLTTVHTNDSVSAVTRLRDLGVPSFLLGATVTGVVAQRLVRLVCPACACEVTLTADELAEMGVKHPEDHAGRLLARRGEGCVKCRFTGHYGRTGVFEVLTLGRRLRQFVSDGAPQEVLSRVARQDGLVSLWENALRKVAAGVTSFEEARRVTVDAEPQE